MPSVKTEFFLTPEGRFVYPFLDLPRTKDPAGKPLDAPKYEVRMYIPKTSPDWRQCKVYAMLAAKVQEVLNAAFRGQWPMRNGENWPIIDCDADPQRLEREPWSAGHWAIALHAGQFRPKVVDQGNNEIPVDITGRFRDFKSGDYGYASINCYSYDNINKGVSFGVEGVKKTRDGEMVGGGQRSVEQMFGGPPAGQPAFPSAPSGYGAAQGSFSQNPAGYGAPFSPPPGQPPQQQPPQQQYGAPPPPQQQYGAPPPPQQQYGAPPPPQQVYGGAPPAGPNGPPPQYAPAGLPPQQPGYGQQGGPGMPPPPPMGPPIGSR
jgi:hypothetical protein